MRESPLSLLLFISSLFMAIGSATLSQAQEKVKSITMRGFVIDGESLTDLPGVHIYTSEKHGTITDGKGFFKIETRKTDTVTFSRIGYETKKIVIKEGHDQSGLVISLKQRIYILDTVDIMTDYYSDSWMIKPERQPVHIEGISRYIDPAYNKYEPGTFNSLQSPVDALYRMFSKRFKEEKKVHSLIIEQEKERELKEKAFGRLDEILKTSGVTLTDEQYDALIQQCTLDLNWIIQTNDYNLYLKIKDCLDRFLEEEK